MAVALVRSQVEQVAGLVDRIDPGVLANERLLPVVEPLGSLLPQAGLRRGTSLATGGCAAMSLALAACGAASQAGSWVALVGLDDIGWMAAREQGVVLERCFAVARSAGDRWAEIVAVAAEGADLVVTHRPPRLAPGQIRRLQARLTTRGAVLLIADTGWRPMAANRATIQPLHAQSRSRGGLSAVGDGESEQPPGGDWSADVWISSQVRSWEGIGAGHGRLVARRVAIEVGGRRAAGRSGGTDLWLPGPSGRLEAAPPHGASNGASDRAVPIGGVGPIPAAAAERLASAG